MSKARPKPRRLPRFKSEREETRFWETHSVADYADQLEDADEVIALSAQLAARIRRRLRKRLVAIRLEEWQISQAKALARARNVPYQQLLRRAE